MSTTRTSLRESAQAKAARQGRACSVCTHPDVDEINRDYRAYREVTAAAIVEWSRGTSRTLTHGQICNHFSRRHDGSA